MALTAEQRATRETGVGASEISAVAGLNPFASAIDVWLTKPTPNRPALAIQEDNGGGPMEVGDVCEPAIIELYRRRTKNAVTPPEPRTMRHPKHAWALASPDGIVDEGRLVEAKMVGRGMLAEWTEDSIPDYVTCQALWQMFVTGALSVDVAMLAGTDFRVYPVARDDGLIEDLYAIGRQFWFDHVLTDIPPPPGPNEDRREYLKKRFTAAGRDIVPIAEGEMEACTELARLRIAAKAAADLANAALAAVDAQFMELIGEHGGITGPWGTATWYGYEGQISYKTIAEQLAPFGKIPAELLAAHRGRPFRRFDFRPFKPKGGR